jgi:hypothetical protein
MKAIYIVILSRNSFTFTAAVWQVHNFHYRLVPFLLLITSSRGVQLWLFLLSVIIHQVQSQAH